MSSHDVRINITQRDGAHIFVCVCDCGWRGPERTTERGVEEAQARATDDAKAHRALNG